MSSQAKQGVGHPRQAAHVKHEARGTAGVVPEPLHVRLLGGFQVSVGPRTIEDGEWRLKKARSLVKLLALAPQHHLHREQVMNLLWPNLAPSSAFNNLRYVLYKCRRILEPNLATASHYLYLRRGQLALCPVESLWTDVEAFREASAAAYRTRDPAAFERAVGLYAGDLLPEDFYEPWAESQREELRMMYLALLFKLIKLYEERNELEWAIETLWRVVTSELLPEEVHAELIRLYKAHLRRYRRALQQYEPLGETFSWQLDGKRHADDRDFYSMASLSDRVLASSLTDLTHRQREVAVLVGRGLTNRQIAAELSISEHTAITHVRDILKKLRLHSRAQIAARITD